ncbi:hypothetical protein RHD99_10980 [Buttiauxella selenatireducens]|uniref:Uncharacterized protein n=1 Tax=Buttiauxella selenatireducens TaxID=3073902 RepID=A0ABY9SGY7_9ENTR|nr:hypothetical protein [Buttiauxella sp. R73]WMY76406.1 hypothetical protein RHD99_10980 [Buttiauxella sp. R73]
MALFIGCLVPKKSPAEKLNLSTYSILKNAPNKKTAAIIIAGEFFQKFSDIAEHYFDAKVIVEKPGTDRPALDEWSTDLVWNKATGDVEYLGVNESTTTEIPTEELKSVKEMPPNFRGAVLSLFGPVERLTNAEYGRVIDLVNDDVSSPEREIAEAISRTSRFFALYPERQEVELTAMRENVRHGAQWTDYKKFLDKRLDAPADKRDAPFVDAERQKAADEKLRTPSGATAGRQNQTDRGAGFVMTHDILALEVALGLVGHNMDFDIYNLSSGVVNRAREIINNKEKPFPQWFESWRSIPGCLDYSRAITIYSVKCAPEGLGLRPGDLIGYLTKLLNETDHEHPAQEIIDAVCGIKSTESNGNEDATKQDDQSNLGIEDIGYAKNDGLEQSTVNASEPAQEPGPVRTVFSLEELETGQDVQTPTPLEMSQREIEVAIAINDALCGANNIMSPEDATELIAASNHKVDYIVACLIGDFITVDEHLVNPILTDEEIFYLMLDVLELWDDNSELRQDTLCTYAKEWRFSQVNREKSRAISTTETDAKPDNLFHTPAVLSHHFTYRQQLTTAALQGLCANPAHTASYDDLPGMASWLADSVISVQECGHGR